MRASAHAPRPRDATRTLLQYYFIEIAFRHTALLAIPFKQLPLRYASIFTCAIPLPCLIDFMIEFLPICARLFLIPNFRMNYALISSTGISIYRPMIETAFRALTQHRPDTKILRRRFQRAY